MFPVTIECSHCSDTGICIVEFFDGLKMPMRCDCIPGRDTAWRLPMWSIDIFKGKAFRIEFPHAWFRPTDGMAGIFGQKMEQWKAKLKLAEEFWEHNGVYGIKNRDGE